MACLSTMAGLDTTMAEHFILDVINDGNLAEYKFFEKYLVKMTKIGVK